MILLNLPYTLERSFMSFIVSEHQWVYIYIYFFGKCYQAVDAGRSLLY